MAGFNFEKNLQHQTQAVESTVKVFDGIEIKRPQLVNKEFVNLVLKTGIGSEYAQNIGKM